MNDLISRAAAIDELNKLDVSDGVGISSIACGVQESAIIAIQRLPSAQPERMRGRWNPDSINGMKPYGYICNLCGAWQPVKRNYCPNCGADMREVSETDG